MHFERDLLPILEQKCFKCHSAPKGGKQPKGGLRLDGKAWIQRGGDGEDAILAGELEDSGVYRRVALPEDDPDFMPSKGDPLTAGERAVLGRWILEGAEFGDWVGAKGPDSSAADPNVPAVVPPRHAMLEALGDGVAKKSAASIPSRGWRRGADRADRSG